MTEDSLTRKLVKSLYSKLPRILKEVNEDPGTGTGTAAAISTLDKGWTYPAHEPVRDRYERGSV